MQTFRLYLCVSITTAKDVPRLLSLSMQFLVFCLYLCRRQAAAAGALTQGVLSPPRRDC